MPLHSKSPFLKIIFRLRALLPASHAINTKEKLRASVGAALGILVVAIMVAYVLKGSFAYGHTFLGMVIVAPIGASAVLVFAVPSSPLAQPWSVIGGNTLSAMAGIACAKWIPDATLAASAAVGMAIVIMLVTRSLHPPGGAAALLMVITGCDKFEYAFSPVMLDSLLLVMTALAYNNLTGRPWPHIPQPKSRSPVNRFSAADLDEALAYYNQILDVNPDDLEMLLERAEASAYERKMGEIRCADVMSRTLIIARQEMPLREAWALIRQNKIKALPVTDRQGHLVGIVTMADFMKQIDLNAHEGMGWHLRTLLRHKRNKQISTTVSEIMTRTVRVASNDRLLTELVPVFSESGHRHIPIIDSRQKLVEIITQSDLIKALYKAVRND